MDLRGPSIITGKTGHITGSPLKQPLRCLFLVSGTSTDASTLNRVLNYMPHLRKLGLRCEVAPTLPRWIGCLENWEHGTQRQKAAYYSLFGAYRLLRILGARRYDVVVLARDPFPFGCGLFERLLFRLHDRVIYDIDDPLYARAGFDSRSVFQRLRCRRKYDDVFRRARAVVVATRTLREYAEQFNRNVIEVPVTMNCDRYGPRTSATSSDPVVIGWTGIRTSFAYLDILRQPLERLARRSSFILAILSDHREELGFRGVNVIFKQWRLETEPAEIAQFDIGVQPLHNGPFERGKFPGKTLQFMAAGLPVVASPVGAATELIEHAKTGFLAESATDWEEHLQTLITNPGLRAQMGAAGRKKVEEHYSTVRYAPVWAELLRAVARGRTP
jgi:glycosyltransferase involved in cell wall biosynthesis